MATTFRALGVAAIVGAAILAAFGDTPGAVAAILVGAGAFLSAPGRTPSAQLYRWLGFALICGGIGVLFSLPVGILLFVAVIGLQFVLTRQATKMLATLQFEAVGPDAVMSGAHGLVQEFSSAAFTAIGGHRFKIGRRSIVVAVMLSPGADRIALVTDRVWQVVSRYGTRWLVTSNSGSAPVPDSVLRQRMDGARPTDLLRAHDAAIALGHERGVRPDRFEDADEALAAARDLERRAIEFVGRVPLHKTVATGMLASGGPLVAGDATSDTRIDRWLATSGSL